jgi:hypothetical protein
MRLPNQAVPVTRNAKYSRGLQRGSVFPAQAAFQMAEQELSPFVGGLDPILAAIKACKCPCCQEVAGHLVCCG